jgi:thiol-disulfide isomerase/thioredoxin
VTVPRPARPALGRGPLAATGLALLLALTGCTGDATAEGSPTTPQLKTIESGQDGLLPPQEREPAPVLDGRTLDGGQLDVSSLRGQVVVVNFWASWCGPCVAEAGNLVSVAEQTADDGVVFVGVNIRDSTAAARAFERQHGVPYESLEDQAGSLLTRFRSLVPQTPPTTLLLDREGRIAARFIGGLTEPELLGPVQALAAEQA